MLADAATSVIGVLWWSAVAHTGVVLLLVPSDPLRPRRAGERFAADAAAPRGAGHDVVLVGHNALAELGGVWPTGRWQGVYRGWMLAGDGYAAFAEVTAKGVTADQLRAVPSGP